MKIIRFVSRAAFLAVATLSLSACATMEQYQFMTHSWVGAPSSELVAKWGYPDRTERLSKGIRLYQYTSINRGSYPQTVIPGSTQIQTGTGQTVVNYTPPIVTGGGSYVERCRTWFQVGRSGVISAARFRGNNCVATKSDVSAFSYSP